MLGAIFGDIVGSVYEFHNIKTKKFRLFDAHSGPTDDSVMTLAVANALVRLDEVAKRDPASAQKEDVATCRRKRLDLFKNLLVEEMHMLGDKYPYAGYGGRFGIWLLTKQTEPYGSYGNGSAMRVSPVAWYAQSLEEAIDFAKASAEVTHNHVEGIKGAIVTAGATYLARSGATMEEIRAFVERYYILDFTLDSIRPIYRFNETCQMTVPQAMQAFFESDSFEDTIRNAISIGGDSDTLAAIAGAVAEAYYGMNDGEVEAVIQRLDETQRMILTDFQKRLRR